jgi:hypothetical protein
MPAIETPCTKICVVDPRSGLCVGCGRSLDEIGQWTVLTDDERRRIMAQLPRRLAALREAAAADAGRTDGGAP